VFDTTGSLTQVIESVQACGPEDRFNAERTQVCIPSSYPQFELLMEIATDGAPIELPEGFIPSGAPEAPRAILQRMPKVMQTHAVKAWMKQAPRCHNPAVYITPRRASESLLQWVSLEYGIREAIGAVVN
jgi:hypothetical protein